jgi:hypothetical protein
MLRVAYCLSPYHLLEALSFYDPSGQMIILAKNGEHYAPLLAELSALTVLPIEERKNVLRELVERNEKFDFYFATLWNRTALLLERAALRSGGHVNIFDDGASVVGLRARRWNAILRPSAGEAIRSGAHDVPQHTAGSDASPLEVNRSTRVAWLFGAAKATFRSSS